MKILFQVAALLAFSFGAQAQPLILPDVFAVYDVAANDTLNVRQAPSGRSADIGDLYPNQRVEVIALNEDGRWGQIIWEEGNGWISMGYLTTVQRPKMADSPMPLDLSCSGNEPFWSAGFQVGEVFEFTDFSALAQKRPIQNSASALGMPPYSFAFQADEFSGLLDRAECSDGMSDRTYGWQLRLIESSPTGLTLRNGCCRALLD